MRILTIAAAIAAGLLLLSSTPPEAQADRELRQRMGEAINLLKQNPDAVDETVSAIEALEGMLEHDMALELLKYFDECDQSFDAAMGERAAQGAKQRPLDAFKIANALLETVRSMGDPEQVVKFEEQINDHNEYSLRPRMAMIDAVARNAADSEECLELLMRIVNNPEGKSDDDMRIIALIHLGGHGSNEKAVNTILLALQDRSWRVRDAAVEACVGASSRATDRITHALINVMVEETGKLRKVIADALGEITGEDLGTDPDEWIDWYRNKQREDEGLPAKSGKGRNRGTRVFETETFSDRFVFLVDSSVSMTRKISPEVKERLKRSITSSPEDTDKRRPLDWEKINTKLDLAREELIRSLEVMDPETTTFTVITFAETTEVWKKELVPTNERNIAEVARWLRAVKGGKKTNVFGAIDEAYDLSEEIAGTDIDKRKRDNQRGRVVTGRHVDEALPDTIFIYTDGYATFGKYSGDDDAWEGKSPQEKGRLYTAIMKDMLKEVNDRNRVARITLNTVGVGERQDRHTLSALASTCNGKYTAIGK